MKNPSLDDLCIFLAVACEGSLNAAAKYLSASPATLSRRVNQLEKEIGKTLFHRSATGYELTIDGESLRERVLALDAVRMELDQWLNAPENRTVVRLSAGTWTSRFLVEHINHLHKSDDNFGLVFISTEERLNIVHREIDIGLRNRQPEEDNLAAKRIGEVTYAQFVADGLELNETSSNRWPWVLIDPACAKTRSARWMVENHITQAALQCTSPHTLFDLVQAGAGVTVLPCFVGDRAKNLKRLGPIIDELTEQQWLVMHGDTRHHDAVRTVLDRVSAVIETNADLYRGERA